MSARTAQFLIAAVFLILGGWSLFAPASVIELAFTEGYRDTSFINRFTNNINNTSKTFTTYWCLNWRSSVFDYLSTC